VIEDLATANMIKNHKLALSISDVGWGEFRRQLEYKCKWYGKNLIVISRWAPSSKLCPECGKLNDKLTLADREWVCECGAKHDRDLLAANNIRSFGIEQYRRNYGNSEACGEILAQVELVEAGSPSL
jgi:putative transposase